MVGVPSVPSHAGVVHHRYKTPPSVPHAWVGSEWKLTRHNPGAISGVWWRGLWSGEGVVDVREPIKGLTSSDWV